MQEQQRRLPARMSRVNLDGALAPLSPATRCCVWVMCVLAREEEWKRVVTIDYEEAAWRRRAYLSWRCHHSGESCGACVLGCGSVYCSNPPCFGGGGGGGGWRPQRLQQYKAPRKQRAGSEKAAWVARSCLFSKSVFMLSLRVGQLITDFSHNRLCEVPCEVCSYHWLEKLLLHHNAIKLLPPALASLSQLTMLDISRNQLSDIPCCINQLTNLRILNLSDNRLTTLPANLGCGLPHLTQLDVSHNQLSSLPASLGHLHHLRSLHLRRNKLQTLPPEVCYLRLFVLDLSSNNITALPSDLRFMLSLTTLLLADNPLLCPPTQVCCRGRVHIFKWLELSAGKEGRRGGVQEIEQRRNRKHLQQQQQLLQQQQQLEQQHLQQLQHPDISRVLSEAVAGQRTTVDSGYSTSDSVDYNRWSHLGHEGEAASSNGEGRASLQSLSGSSTPSTLSPTDAGLSLEDEFHKAMKQRLEFDLVYGSSGPDTTPTTTTTTTTPPLPAPPDNNNAVTRGRSSTVEEGSPYSPHPSNNIPPYHIVTTTAPVSPSTVPTYKDYLESKRQQRALEAGRVYRSATAEGAAPPCRPDSLSSPTASSPNSLHNGNWTSCEADRAHVKNLQKEAVLSYVKSRVSPTKESQPGSLNTSFDSGGVPESSQSPVPAAANGHSYPSPVSSYLHSSHGPGPSLFPLNGSVEQASYPSNGSTEPSPSVGGSVDCKQSYAAQESTDAPPALHPRLDPSNSISNGGRPTSLSHSRSNNKLNNGNNNNGSRPNGSASCIPTLRGSSNTPSPTSPLSPSLSKTINNTRPSSSSSTNNSRTVASSTRSTAPNKTTNGKLSNGSAGSNNRTSVSSNRTVTPASAAAGGGSGGRGAGGVGVGKAPLTAQHRRRGSGAGMSGIPGSMNGVRDSNGGGYDSEPGLSKMGFTYRREMEKQQHEKQLLDNLRNIIESRLKVTLPSNLGSALIDGVVLCHLVNHVRPRAVPSIHVPSPAVPKLTVAKCRLNVESFLDACKRIGVEEELLPPCNSIVEPPFDAELLLATVLRMLDPHQPLPDHLLHLLPSGRRVASPDGCDASQDVDQSQNNGSSQDENDAFQIDSSWNENNMSHDKDDSFLGEESDDLTSSQEHSECAQEKEKEANMEEKGASLDLKVLSAGSNVCEIAHNISAENGGTKGSNVNSSSSALLKNASFKTSYNDGIQAVDLTSVQLNTSSNAVSERRSRNVNNLVAAFEKRQNSVEEMVPEMRQNQSCNNSINGSLSREPTTATLSPGFKTRLEPPTDLVLRAEDYEEPGSANVDVLNTRRFISGGSLDLSVPDLVTSTNGCSKIVPSQGASCIETLATFSTDKLAVSDGVMHSTPTSTFYSANLNQLPQTQEQDPLTRDQQSSTSDQVTLQSLGPSRDILGDQTIDEGILKCSGSRVSEKLSFCDEVPSATHDGIPKNVPNDGTCPPAVRDDRFLSMCLIVFFALSVAILITFPIGE
ncbi:Leucine rich repeat 4 [Trinorchestia longiramus]|nr:Leucine rich repeat 4 [Trinorchestia longiramus]